MDTSAGLDQLRRMSARIGRDVSLVQGAGGNTSIKIGDVLWVKASGCRLSDALERPTFVQLSLGAVRKQLANGAPDERFESAILPALDGHGLRPSIETALHALLPFPAIVHAHSVNCTTASILANGREWVRAALEQRFRWTWIPYRRPGLPLASAVANAWESTSAEVYILENHGVIIGAADCDAAAQILEEIERRISFVVRRPISRAQSVAPATTHYEATPQKFAYDAQMAAFLTEAARFPDQVVFLGGPVPRARNCADADLIAERAKLHADDPPPYVFVEGIGLLASRQRTRAAEPTMNALHDIGTRIPPGEPVKGLTGAQVDELLGWEAEQHRRILSQ